MPGYEMVTIPSTAAYLGSTRPTRSYVLYHTREFPMVPNIFQLHGTTVVDCCSSLHTTRGAIAHHSCLQPPGQTNTTLLTCLSMALCTCGSEPTIIAGDFHHQHVGTQHPKAQLW